MLRRDARPGVGYINAGDPPRRIAFRVATYTQRPAVWHEMETVHREVQQHLLQRMTIRRYAHPTQLVPHLNVNSCLFSDRLQKFPQVVQKLAQVDCGHLRLSCAVELKNVVDSRRKRTKSSLNVTHPRARLLRQGTVGKQAGEQFHAGERISYLMCQDR